MAPVCLRDLTPAECAVVQTLAHSRTAPAHRVQRAQIIWRARCGESASAIAARVGLDGETVRKRIRRFNAEGLEALKDRPRSGRRPTYSPEQTATVIASALSKPQTLGLPFAAWTLDRLATDLHEAKGIAMQRSRIDEILLHEGLRWRKHETWFGERVDPAFAEKGADRNALHHTACGQLCDLSGRNGAGERQELCRSCSGADKDPTGRASPTGDRLWPPRQRLCLWRVLSGNRRSLHASLSGTRQCALGRLPRPR
jgi:transposase